MPTRLGFPDGATSGSDDRIGVQGPMDPIYQDYRDFYSVGVGVTLMVLGARAEVHLVQIWDFLGGFVGFDIAHDDYATTRGLALTPRERGLLGALNRIEQARHY